MFIPDPAEQRLLRLRRNFELDRSLGLLLNHQSSFEDAGSVSDILNLEFHQVTASKFAIDGQIE